MTVAYLKELASFYRMLQEQIEANDGEVSDEMLEDLDRYSDSIDSKVDAIAVLMTDAEMWADRHKADAAESSHMARVKSAQVARFKVYLKHCMETAGLERAGRKYAHGIRMNSRPSFTWEGERKDIPDSVARVIPEVRELDTNACLELYQQSGGSSAFLPPGVVATRGKHIQACYRKGKKVVSDGEE
jgi:hypothetical protein